MFSRLISVVGSVDDRERLEAYLYAHSSIVAVMPSTDNLTRVEFLVLTQSSESQDNVDYLANYQAGRLSSGLFGARVLPSEV